MIKFDAVDFSERRSEEVISCFWRLVYHSFNSLVFVYSDGPKMHVIMQLTASRGVLQFSGLFTSIEASDRKMYWLENVWLSYTALIWQKEASDKIYISCKTAKYVCHLHLRQWNSMISYLTYLISRMSVSAWQWHVCKSSLHELWKGTIT